MIKCYDFFNCKNLDCVRRKTEDLQCWEIQNTLCNTQNDSAEQLQAAMENNKSFCEYNLCRFIFPTSKQPDTYFPKVLKELVHPPTL